MKLILYYQIEVELPDGSFDDGDSPYISMPKFLDEGDEVTIEDSTSDKVFETEITFCDVDHHEIVMED